MTSRKLCALSSVNLTSQSSGLQIYVTSPSSTSDDSSDTLEDAGQSPRKRGRKTHKSNMAATIIGTIKVTPRAIAYVAVQVGLIDFSSA